MPEGAAKRCLVALDTVAGVVLVCVHLPGEGTVADALAQARRQLCPEPAPAAIDWDGGAAGIWGVRCERTAVPRHGDRIELYRPLLADPRQRRRQRARAGVRR